MVSTRQRRNAGRGGYQLKTGFVPSSLLTKKEKSDMFNALLGWLPISSRVVGRGECVFSGDCLGPVLTHRARGLADLALNDRLFYCSRLEASAGRSP